AGSKPLLVGTALVYSLALLGVRRLPLPAVALSFGAIGVMALVTRDATNEATAPLFAGLATSFLVARFGTRDQARVGLALGIGLLVLVARDQPTLANGIVTFVIAVALVAVAWGIGYSLRERGRDAAAAHERATRAEAGREAAARLAVAEERARIARELHDIVAHSVSMMVLQAGAVRHNLPAQLTDDKDALRNVERAGREALSEMRRLLGAMRSDDEGGDRAPQPSLTGLGNLVDDMRRAGLPAGLAIEGDPRSLPLGMELSAYRIVQEGLTNALKHAHAQHVDVRLRYDADALSIEVRDDGCGGATDDGLGHGLIGISERVKVYGGEMSAGRGPDGGFVLRSRLPIERAST
ncbi:MAG: histidine kinase, dimerization and phosphoacceptor region, partial [Solirubrobacterales bacterium]|nr:histidine kinase, dimerization and phosphoacceptor region [Solirubrobacterales bacterium]